MVNIWSLGFALHPPAGRSPVPSTVFQISRSRNSSMNSSVLHMWYSNNRQKQPKIFIFYGK